MAADDIWTLIAKKLSGEASTRELKALKSLVADNASLKQTIITLELAWQATDKQTTTSDLGKKWESFRLKLTPDPRHQANLSTNRKIKIKK